MNSFLDLLPVATMAADLAADHLRTHLPTSGTRRTAKGDRDLATETATCCGHSTRSTAP